LEFVYEECGGRLNVGRNCGLLKCCLMEVEMDVGGGDDEFRPFAD